MDHSTLAPYFPTNLDDYAPWVAIHGLTAPYGQCQCGCGGDVATAAQNHSRYGWKNGHPIRYIAKHQYGPQDPVAKLYAGIVVGSDDECWLWQGRTSTYGYGQLSVGGIDYQAHRVMYEHHYGPIPTGLYACHKCDNPPCCNPHHLFLGTPADNMADKIAKNRHNAPHGERQGHARLTDDLVREIRLRAAQGAVLRELAKEYGVSHTAVISAVNRKTWRHVE